MPYDRSPLFSVIINNYNYSEFLSASIQSILDQTTEDFELIVVDDGSTDRSRDIILGFKDKRMIAVLKENGGQASALNAGFERAKGKYVSFLDSDDLFDSDKLSRVLKVFEGSHYALVQHQLRVIDRVGKETGALFPSLQHGELDVLPSYFRRRHTSFFSSTSGITAPRRILRRIFPLPEREWRICADAPLTRPLPVFGKIYTLPDPAGYYRTHNNNNWMNSPKRRKNSLLMTWKINRYTNMFLRRWGIHRQIEIPFPAEWLAAHELKSVAIYGAGKHTRALLEGQGLPPDLAVTEIIDDKPSKKAIAGLRVRPSSRFLAKCCDAVLISSDSCELEMTRKALSRGWSNVLPIYMVESFRPTQAGRIHNLAEQLRKQRKKRIAIYGAGVHSLKLLLSGLLPADIKVTCLLDEKPSGKRLWGVPICTPMKADRSSFDAVVLSSDVYEKRMFYKARDYGFGSIFLIYGEETALKQNRADFEDVRKSMASSVVRKVALYDPRWFMQCLLQSGYLDDAEVTCVLTERKAPALALYGVPIIPWRTSAVPPFDLLIVPPRTPASVILELKERFSNKLLVLPENPDEIGLMHAFLRERAPNGTMLDVGANVGVSLKPFAADGWRIHAFEPDSVHRRKLEKLCADYERVSVYPLALSNIANKKLPLYRSRVSGGISGLSVFHHSHYFSEFIKTTKLASFVRKQRLRRADFLKIDTEGYDLFVLQGNNWKDFRPRVIMCEYENHKTIPLGYDFEAIAGYLHKQNYSLLISQWNPVVEYGNQPRWRCFVDYPCQLHDPDAFGNIFAFRDKTDFDMFKTTIGAKSC